MAMRGMLLAVVSALLLHAACVAEAQTLRLAYYNQTCPSAEAIVFDEVQKASRIDNRTPAALLRLHFHDCFVNVSFAPLARRPRSRPRTSVGTSTDC